MDFKKPDETTSPYYILLVFAALVIVIAGLKLGADLLVPFLLAGFFAVILAPVTFYLNRFMSLSIALLLVLFFAALIVFFIGNMIMASISTFSQYLPQIELHLSEKYQAMLNWMSIKGFTVDKAGVLSKFGVHNITSIISNVLSQLGNVFSLGFIIGLTAIFMLFEAKGYESKLRRATNNSEGAIIFSRQVVKGVRQYLVIKSFTSLLTGILIGLGCLVLGVRFALLWGFLAFLLNFIPNIGSILAALPAVLLVLVSPESTIFTMAALLILYLLVNVIVGNIVEPKVMGRGMGLSTLIAFVSLVFWGWLFGIVGMFLSVPLTMVLKTFLEASPRTKSIAIMLGE